jgi:hypothetical protein
MKLQGRDVDAFTAAYLEAAMWTSDPEPGQGEYQADLSLIDGEFLSRAINECRDFQEVNGAWLEHAGCDEQNGHDFWLTRNRHGAGFWDRGYGKIGQALTDACRPYGADDGPVFADRRDWLFSDED